MRLGVEIAETLVTRTTRSTGSAATAAKPSPSTHSASTIDCWTAPAIRRPSAIRRTLLTPVVSTADDAQDRAARSWRLSAIEVISVPPHPGPRSNPWGEALAGRSAQVGVITPQATRSPAPASAP